MGRITMSPGIYFAGAPRIAINYDQISDTDIEDGAFSSGQFVINPDGNGPGNAQSGVYFSVTDPAIMSAFAAETDNNGYVWTATWTLGSTQTTTPVAMYYGDGGPGGVLFFVLDPADNTYTTGLAGTFKFPVAFTPGHTPTTANP
jgi:hypothetical protein